MIYIYRGIYFILKTLLLVLKPLLASKLKSWVDLRNQEINKTSTYNNTYWFHASSGEIEYCKSVIRLLKEQKPETQIIVTYSSPSAEKLFHNITIYVDQFIPLCWDQVTSVNQLIDYIKPKVLVFSRTDLWPELITQAHARNIKKGVISFNPSFGFFNNLMLSSFLPQLDFISCVDENIKHQLKDICDLKNISVDGDTRFDQVFYRLSQETKLKITSDSKVFICGSTWPEDEDILLECFQTLIKNNFKIVLSPHEVQTDNILRLEKELDRRGFKHQLLSKETNFLQISLTTDILIIDKIGYLADAYRFSDIAFVGGSYKEKIHSVMEPLCCGLPVITGPFFKNNPEAVKYQNQYVFSTNSSEEVIANVKKLSDFSKDEILFEMKKNKNASDRVLTLLQTRL